MDEKKIYRFVSITAFVLITILLFSVRGYLLKFPILGGFLLLIFGILFLIGFIRIKQSTYIYPVVLLTSCSYYLFLYILGVNVTLAPLFSIPIVFVLYIISRKAKVSSISLNLSVYFVTIIFTLYILTGLVSYIKGNTWLAVIPVLLFSVYYFLRSFELRKAFQLYIALILFSFTFLLILYGIRILPLPYFGLFLICLCMLMMAIGSKYHSRVGFNLVRSTYIVGILISLLAFFYASKDRSILLLSTLLFGLHYFGIGHKVILKPTAGRAQEILFYRLFFALSTLSGFACAILLFCFMFPQTIGVLITTLGFSILFIIGGLKCKGPISSLKRPYIYLSVFFATSFYLLLLSKTNPFGSVHMNMLLVPILLVFYLSLGLRMEKRKHITTGNYIYESSYSILIASFVLPLIVKDYIPTFSSLLILIFLVVYFFFALLSKRKLLFYPIALVLSFLYYNLLRMAPISPVSLGFYLLLASLVGWILSIIYQESKPFWGGIFLFAFFVLSVLSIVSGLPYKILSIYIFSIFGLLYLFRSQILKLGGGCA